MISDVPLNFLNRPPIFRLADRIEECAVGTTSAQLGISQEPKESHFTRILQWEFHETD